MGNIKRKVKLDKKEIDCWYLNGDCVLDSPEGYYGFVYLITNLKEGRIYVGKKAFLYRRKTKLSKKAKKATGKRVKVDTVDSKWLSYFGSSLELNADVKRLGQEYFKREILHLCKSKAQMNYMEAKEQFSRGVLEMPTSYNKWIGCRIFKTKFLTE